MSNDSHPDEFTGVTINGDTAIIPPEARVTVSIDTRDWGHFEEMVAYLAEIELPGLSATRLVQGVYHGDTPTVVRSNASYSVYLMVKTPRPNPASAGEEIARAEGVLTRVLRTL